LPNSKHSSPSVAGQRASRDADLAEALPLEQAVVEGRRAHFGAAHPDTLKALGKLAATVRAPLTTRSRRRSRFSR
jgi:hypothetical protein